MHPFDKRFDDPGQNRSTLLQTMQSRPPKSIQTGVTASVGRCRRESNCLIILSGMQHQKVEVFMMWSGPRNVTTISHDIWDAGPAGLCESMPKKCHDDGPCTDILDIGPAGRCESMSIAPF